MDNLFGVPLSSYLIALTLLVGLIFCVLGYIWWRNRLLVSMGLRNVARRKTQTVLIVIGLMLSTLIISAAFATGDTVGYSVSNEIYGDLQQVDIVMTFDRSAAPAGVAELTDENLERLREAFADDPDIDGISGILQTRVPVINTAEGRAEPVASFVAVDPETIGAMGGLIDLDGNELDPGELGGERVFITEDLSDGVGLETGERFTIYYDNQPYEFEVAGVILDNGMTSPSDDAGQVFDAGGFVTTIERYREITGTNDVEFIGISVTGGVRNSLDLVDDVEERIDAYIESSGEPLQVIFTKTELVNIAELVGSLFVTIFIVFGLFSIAAGIMLIFLTFVMLAAERRPEMGMARAVGMKRLHLTQMFVAEGMAYNVGSALVGALLGLGVAYILVWAMGNIVEEFGFDITYHVNPQGFIIAYFLGLVITFATVAFSSWRAANLNIVGAIRDLPDPDHVTAEDRSLRRLTRSVVAVVWTLAWIGLVIVWSVAAFLFFTLGLSTYGAGLIVGGLLAGAYIWGVTRVNRPWSSLSLRGRIGYVLWWIAFNLMAFITWLLFRTRAWANRYKTSGGWAIWMLIIGVLAIWWGGWVSSQAFAYTAGTTLLLFALAMLAVFFGAAPRPSFTIASLLVLWYWLLPLPFSLFLDDADGFTDPLRQLATLLGVEPEDEIEGNIEMFFVSGIALTAAATVFFIYNADRLINVLNVVGRLLGGIAPAVRTAISYPLAAKFRTAMTLAMFSLVVFSLVVMATLNHNFTQLFLGEDAKGGFDIRVNGSPSNRIDDLGAALREAGYDVDGTISGIGTLRTDDPQVRVSGSDDEFEPYLVQGVDEAFIDLADFPLATRAVGYESDEAVLQALLTDPTVAIVDQSRVAQEDPFNPNASDFHLGPTLTELQDAPWQPIPVEIEDPETGETFEVRVIGVLESQVTGINTNWVALFVNQSVVEDQLGGGETESFYLTTFDDSRDATVEIASSIEAALLERGVLATSIQDAIDDAAAQSSAFQVLFEGFMGLGLIVGIAALGVISFRTVAERRQQIGMLRALGYTRRLVATSFFLESSFIALSGILLGLFLGTALSYNLLNDPELVGEGGSEIDFGFPWLRLLIIVGIAYGASAIMTIIPARSASNVSVAEALRYAG